jgi:RNA polymerase sigma-70 factor (ECF subfamily)
MSQADSSTQSSLLVRLRDAADHSSWQIFVDTYGPLLYHYCRRRGLQDADAADVAQDALLEVARCLRNFEYRPDVGRFRDWLGTIVFRKLARFLERKNRREIPAGGDTAHENMGQVAAENVDSEWTDEFNARVLQVALSRIQVHFEPATWRVFARLWLENTPPATVAQDMGLGIERVYLAKSRILKRLEEEVALLADDASHLIRPV